MFFEVQLTDDAAQDLEQIFDYLSQHRAAHVLEQIEQDRAAHVLEQIEQAFQALSALPERGSCPRELLELGIREYREVFFKPYRIIYRVMGDDVYVLMIADGRRDMRALLQRRLLRV